MLRNVLFSFLFISLGAVAAVIVVAIIIINMKPDTQIWHEVYLDEEFTHLSELNTLDEYLELEDRLFSQLQTHVYDAIDETEKDLFNRYSAGSKSDPNTWTINWNRTFVLEAEEPAFGVLLLHGYSDSPYSLRSIGQNLHEKGATVLGLRIPGHGTAPSGLRHTTVEDMAAAVRLAISHLEHQLDDRPLYIVGYSNGAALALHHTLLAIQDPTISKPSGIILLSPEIEVTRFASLARWQSWFGELLGLDKLAWNSIGPEYDPFKYNSFAVNAGEQSYRLTTLIQTQLDELKNSNQLERIPPILAFQSAVDATVSAPAVMEKLFNRLVSGNHHLVIFDVNRIFEALDLLSKPIDLERLLYGSAQHYTLGIVTNRNESMPEVILRERLENSDLVQEKDLGLAWPDGIYSLSHIALPFLADDPLYGNGPNPENPGLHLGMLALRGENRTLAIPKSALTRQHWNPFFEIIISELNAYLEKNIEPQN
jgi:alpha-beta hydrolase superfamily lysophospholipase